MIHLLVVYTGLFDCIIDKCGASCGRVGVGYRKLHNITFRNSSATKLFCHSIGIYMAYIYFILGYQVGNQYMRYLFVTYVLKL